MNDDAQVIDDEEPAAPPLREPGAEMLFGAGQAAWLAVVSVGVLVALAVSFVALFLAMNDDDPVAVPAGGGAPATSLTVEATEFEFDPADVTIAADTDVEVTLDNVGAVEHNWTVLEAGTTIDDESQFDEALEIVHIHADAGEATSDTVNLVEGSYQVICTIPGHFSAGMAGTLEVVS